MSVMLRAPLDHKSVCIGLTQYEVHDGHVDVSEEDAKAVMLHDSRFTIVRGQYVTEPPSDPPTTKMSPLGLNDDAIADASRFELFDYLKTLGVIVNRTSKTDDLRSILKAEVAKAKSKEAVSKEAVSLTGGGASTVSTVSGTGGGSGGSGS